jgi:hypothetical protein
MKAVWGNAAGSLLAAVILGVASLAWNHYNGRPEPILLYLSQAVPLPRWLLIVGLGTGLALVARLFLRRDSAVQAPPPKEQFFPVQVNIYANGQLLPAAPAGAQPAAPAATAPGAPPLLVENGSFEQGTEGWGTGFFESYFATPGGSAMMFRNAVARWFIDDQRAHSGKRALRIEHSSSYAPDVFSSFSQRIKVKPAQRYEASYWAYLEATDRKGSFSLRVVPSRRAELHEWDRFRGKIDPALVGQWQHVHREFESGSDTYFDLRFAAETAMKLWVDDVTVTLLLTN